MKRILIGLLLISILLVPYASADLVSYWSFNNVSDPGKDYSGGNDGTVYGAAWKVEGFNRSAMDFDGADDYIDCGHDASLDLENFTLTAWVKLRENRTQNMIARKAQGPNKGWGFFIHNSMFPTLSFDFFYGNGSTYDHINYRSDTNLKIGRWYQVAVAVSNGNSINFYLNGIPDGKRNVTENFLYPERPLMIGRSETGIYGGYTNGIIDEVRVYNHILSAEEILERYSEEKEVYSPADVNEDGIVDIYDVILVATRFGQTGSHHNWNWTIDIVPDSEINIFDVVFVTSRFSDVTPPKVVSFDIQPRNTESSVSAQWTVTDNEALKNAELWKTKDSNGQPDEDGWEIVFRGSKSISGTTESGQFSDSPGDGSWWYRLKVVDYSDNEFYSHNISILKNISAPPNGKIVHAASCNLSDVQAAIDLADNGDIMQIPAGTCNWNGYIMTQKEIHIRGAGREQTIIRKASDIRSLFIYEGTWDAADVPNHEQFKFSGIKLLDPEGPYEELIQIKRNQGLTIRYGAKDFEVFDSEFEGFAEGCVFVRGYESLSHPLIPDGRCKGVIYNNKFINCYMPQLGYGVSVHGVKEIAWENYSLNLGGEDAVFIEDNYFSGARHAIASGYGSSYVCRYNIIENNRRSHMVDAHGWANCSNKICRGSRSYEIYENILIGNDQYDPDGIKIRGGDGVIFNNTMHTYVAYPIFLDHDNRGSCVDIEGYPCRDQIRELYIWDNTEDGNPITSDDIKVYDFGAYDLREYIMEGRDWFMYPRPDYIPYPYPHPLRK